MARNKRGRKPIGRKKKTHSKQQSANKPESVHGTEHPSPAFVSEHSYAMKSECKSALVDCDGTGPSFANCDCILHECSSSEFTPYDAAELEADKYYLIAGTKSCEYSLADDLDLLTFELLSQYTRQLPFQQENKLTTLGFSMTKTTEKLHFMRLYEQRTSVMVAVSLTINPDLSHVVSVHRKPIPKHHDLYMIKQIFNFQDIVHQLERINSYVICYGSSDDEFINHYSDKGEYYIEGDCGADYVATLRSTACSFLTLNNLRCEPCKTTRHSLRIRKSRLILNQDPHEIDLSSKKPNCSMPNDQLLKKTTLLKSKVRLLDQQNRRLKAKAAFETKCFEAPLNETDSSEISNLVQECTPDIQTAFPDEDSFERIFLEEQLKFNNLKNKGAMRWHPLVVKWALLLKSKSAKAYQVMREQGFIHLPSERTLYDYSHRLPSKLGYAPEVLDMLRDECEAKGMFDHEWSSYVGLLQDEVKVKNDLVYCATTGQLVGYVHLDDTSNQILELERQTNEDNNRNLATSALVIMVRGITTSLKFPLAAFATNKLDSNQIYLMLWRAIELLECNARPIKCLFITCDGASQNRKFFEMNPSGNDGEPVYSTQNVYADDDRQIYFISDVPHLLKTSRNNFSNSNSHHKSRLLWNNGQDILWTHIVNLYADHIENNLFTKSKLTRAHVDLTPFSCMKVSLAAQVLSRKVASQLQEAYGDKVRETVKFIEHMNRFFDCLNTRNLNEGENTRNPDMDPYTDANDPRLTWLENSFLGYFEDWKTSVNERPGNFSKQDRDKMQLSQQTLDGLKISVRSIVACVRYLLEKGAPFVLTAFFNQDVLEQHFGHYRHKGGACNNPAINDVRHTINTLRIVGSSFMEPLRGGNTKRTSGEQPSASDSRPLPRKKSRPSSSQYM